MHNLINKANNIKKNWSPNSKHTLEFTLKITRDKYCALT